MFCVHAMVVAAGAGRGLSASGTAPPTPKEGKGAIPPMPPLAEAKLAFTRFNKCSALKRPLISICCCWELSAERTLFGGGLPAAVGDERGTKPPPGAAALSVAMRPGEFTMTLPSASTEAVGRFVGSERGGRGTASPSPLALAATCSK